MIQEMARVMLHARKLRIGFRLKQFILLAILSIEPILDLAPRTLRMNCGTVRNLTLNTLKLLGVNAIS